MADLPKLGGVVPIDRTNLTLADRVESQLRDEIVQARRRPGDRLNEGEIAAYYGVSRGPVREAVRRLAHRGLVRVESHRGAYVRTLDLGDVRNLFEVRIALECEATELAALRITDEGVAELKAFQRQSVHEVAHGQAPGVFDAHDLHELVVRHAGNPQLARMVRQVNVELRLARSRSGAGGQRAHQAVEEHQLLIGCLTSGDASGARGAMREHLAAALHNTIQLLHETAETEAGR